VGTSLAIQTTTLPDAYGNVAYSQTLVGSGGTLPYYWSVKSGALPAGMTLAIDGTLSGAPAVSGTFSFTVEMKESSSPANR